MSVFTESKNITNNTSDIVVILDNSGSMESMGKEPVQAINEFINEQKNVGEDSSFSLWQFNSKPKKVIDKVKLRDVGSVNETHPSGGTALYDTIQEVVENNTHNSNVTVVIVTDGQDNMSQKCNLFKCKNIINDCEKNKGWKFHYLGANQDSFAVANQGLGISSCQNYSTNSPESPGLSQILRSTSAGIKNHRQTSISGHANSRPSTITTPTDIEIDDFDSTKIPPPPTLVRTSAPFIENDTLVQMAVKMLTEENDKVSLRRSTSR